MVFDIRRAIDDYEQLLSEIEMNDERIDFDSLLRDIVYSTQGEFSFPGEFKEMRRMYLRTLDNSEDDADRMKMNLAMAKLGNAIFAQFQMHGFYSSGEEHKYRYDRIDNNGALYVRCS